MVDNQLTRKAEEAQGHFVQIADDLDLHTAAKRFAEATKTLRQARGREQAQEKARIEAEIRAKEVEIAKIDKEQDGISAKIAAARGENDTQEVHKWLQKSQSVAWGRQEAARVRAGWIAKLAAQPTASDAWYGSKDALLKAWRAVNFGPDHAQVWDLLHTEWRDLRADEQVSLRYTIDDGKILDYAPKAK